MRRGGPGALWARREQGIVLRGGKELSLTKTEFRLLVEFADEVERRLEIGSIALPSSLARLRVEAPPDVARPIRAELTRVFLRHFGAWWARAGDGAVARLAVH